MAKVRVHDSDTVGRLDARLRELECHHAVSRILEEAGDALGPVLSATADVLPSGWSFPEDACARIVVRTREGRTRDWEETAWRQIAPILVHGQTVGTVEVGYRRNHPFLEGEEGLLESVAQRLGLYVERVETAHRLAAQQAELRKRLLHLTRITTVGEMGSSIAHEVNQPLTAIATYAQACRRMLQSESGPLDEVSRVLGRITEEALRAGQIIHRLRDLVRRRESERKRWSLNALILQVAPLATVDARLHDVELRLELAAELPPVMVDGIQIQQVVLNLVRNGVDALDGVGESMPEVVVRTTLAPGREVLVSVSDQGCGMPEKSEEELYQPFFTTKREGIGMGLSISRSIVLMHGGRLWFEANSPRGTTFHFTLPVAEEEPDE